MNTDCSVYNLQILLILCIILVIIGFGISLIYVSSKLTKIYSRHRERLEEITKYEIEINATIDEGIPRLLELFVQEVFNDYRVKELEMTTGYINSQKEEEIIKTMSQLCSERLSPAMVNKLSLFWSPNSIGSVIADKIYLTVVAYVAKNNAIHEGSM